jgi:hypothetical protein
MKYAAEIGSGDMTHIPSITNIDSGIQNLLPWNTHSKIISKAQFNFFELRKVG